MFKFNYSFKIGKHKIKQFNKPYIIAEAGSNHNQRLGNAIKLSKIAKAAGCNAIKFQIIYPEGIAVGPKSKHGKLKNKFKIYSNNLFDLYSKCSLKFEEFKKVKSFCDKIKIDMLASVFCNRSLKDAIKLKLKAIKIASLELYDPLLLKSVAKSKKPIILSTGTSNINDINFALKIIKKEKNNKLILLQCTSSYPTLKKDANINSIKFLHNKYNIPIGFSDHTQSNLPSICAITLGSPIFEKHFTINRKMKGPDHFFSLEPKELKNYVEDINEAFISLGKEQKKMTFGEKKDSHKGRRTIYIARDVKKNEKLTLKNLKIVRPAKGLDPKKIFKIINKKFTKNLKEDTPLKNNFFK